ncbi:hypothetical protein niasHS_013693 [Heterodera schachtii]|uniref:JmjC domain-containing protein n=1 Tax=Heterodera schachtii TaxID=97005 RepID=A0ABD2IA43_HETSC
MNLHPYALVKEDIQTKLHSEELVGGTRQIEVFDVYTQKGKNMQLKDFVKYFNAPAFVRDIDWIDNVWPKELLARQKNLEQSAWARKNEFSIYPKVQKYCIMSVKKCFTDFHIDFGGTAVWYHVLKGEKVFWLIEPTEENLKLYEKWMLAGNDDTRFLGKLTKCTRVRLRQGQTMIIPSGWIHSVYTPVDSLVFGGNFMHSYSIPMQIRISHLEDRIKPEKKYRFPHFNQIFWCFIAQIVQKATHRRYQRKLSPEAHNINGSPTISNFLRSLPPLVINGLFPLLKYTEHLLKLTHPEVIEGITRPHHLVKEFRALLNKIKKLGLRDQKI